MSLIPSESYSFPDHFTSTRAGSRKPKNIEPEREPELEPEEQFIEPIRQKPAIVALPNPKPRMIARPQPLPKPQPVVAEPELLTEPEPLVMPEHMMELEPLPEPEPIVAKEIPKPVRKIAPPVSIPLRRASAPPAKTPPIRKLALPRGLKPKARWNNRAPAVNPAPIVNNGDNNGNGASHLPYEPLIPAENVIQMKPAPPAPRPARVIPRLEKIPPPPPLPQRRPAPVVPRPTPVAFAPPQKPIPAPKPAPKAREIARPVAPKKVEHRPVSEMPRPAVAPTPQGDFFEDFAQSGETAISKRRRKAKLRRFWVCESIAVGVLLPLAFLGLAHRPENLALVWIMNILTIASAVAAALIPILFFAVTPTLPEIER